MGEGFRRPSLRSGLLKHSPKGQFHPPHHLSPFELAAVPFCSRPDMGKVLPITSAERTSQDAGIPESIFKTRPQTAGHLISRFHWISKENHLGTSIAKSRGVGVPGVIGPTGNHSNYHEKSQQPTGRSGRSIPLRGLGPRHAMARTAGFASITCSGSCAS